MPIRLKCLCFLVVALAFGTPVAAVPEPDRNLLDLDIDTLLTIEVGPSADASAKGLSLPFAGGQVADGGRSGLLGTRELLDTPFSVTSYTAEFIQNQQASSVGDVLEFDSSVRVTRGFGNFQQAYMIRGLPIFSDDMSYNGLYGILPRQYLAAELIERVEVLRGANAFLNGASPSSSGIGGAVNVVPKRALNKDLNRWVLGTESDGQRQISADIARRSDDNRLGMRLNGVSRAGDTAVEGESRELGMATLGADFQSDALRISADLGYQNNHLDGTMPSIDIGNGLSIPDAPDADNSIAQPWTYSEEEDVFGTLRAEYEFNDSVTAWIAGGRRESNEKSRLTAFLTVINDAGDFSANRFDVSHEDSVTTGDMGFRLRFNTGAVAHRLTLSANAYRNEGRNAYAVFDALASNLYHPVSVPAPANVTFAGGDLSDPLVTAKTQSSSFAIADEFALLNQRLLLTLGARQQNIREYSYDYENGEKLTRYDESVVTPAAGAVYKLAPHLSLYFNYIEGLLKGDFAPATNSDGVVANAGEALQPYQAKQTELGLKFERGTLGGALALYSIRMPIAGYNNRNELEEHDTQVNHGLEFTVFGKPADAVRILGGASWLTTDVNGNDTIGAPSAQANLNLEWDIPQLSGLTLGTQWMYTGAQYADADNLKKVPAWHRIDLGVRYGIVYKEGARLTLRARVENIAGSDYWASSGGYPGQGYLTVGEPRHIKLSASLEY